MAPPEPRLRPGRGDGMSSGSLPPLREILSDGRVHLMDGAMGTMLYDRGVFVNVCYDDLSRSEPRLVERIHREYVQAGAQLVETNTFGANPVKLSAFGLEEETETINAAGARLARRGAGKRAHVLGAMGPLGIRMEPWGPTSEAEARDFFARQVAGLLEGGVDGFILETFQDPNELLQGVRAARALSDLPVFALVTVGEGGRTPMGADVSGVVRLLEEEGVDALGFNCSVGPAEVLDAVERAAALTDLPIVAAPNAGLPRTVGDRKMYLAGPDYMARYARRMVEAGARFVGGCCGTTPDHIRQMARAVVEAGERVVAVGGTGEVERGARVVRDPNGGNISEGERAEGPLPTLAERSLLGAALQEGTFPTLMELLPPRGWDTAPLLEAVDRATSAGVTAIALPDSPRGLPRMGSLAAAALLIREQGVEVLAHYASRDRNMSGILSELMGAAASGVRNLLLVTGDLPPGGPYPDHTTFLDIDSIGLVNLVHALNRGVDPGGAPLSPATRFVAGVSLNQGSVDSEREGRRFRYKVEAGAEFAVTQPVFDPDALHRYLDRHPDHRIPIIAGIWPLTSLANAEFLANEVPGVSVPRRVLRRMEEAQAKGSEEARAEGIRIAVESLKAVRPIVSGVHVSAPLGRVENALEVLEAGGLTGASPGSGR